MPPTLAAALALSANFANSNPVAISDKTLESSDFNSVRRTFLFIHLVY
ncbi:MAG: hypothetical protein GXP26_12160 [Planctomycetes bacterium]|nr:hypothetical protein [Planctomycetota bacterium]